MAESGQFLAITASLAVPQFRAFSGILYPGHGYFGRLPLPKVPTMATSMSSAGESLPSGILSLFSPNMVSKMSCQEIRHLPMVTVLNTTSRPASLTILSIEPQAGRSGLGILLANQFEYALVCGPGHLLGERSTSNE